MLEKKNTEALFRLLEKLDPQRAKHIDKHNPRRLIRAIEVALALGAVPPITKQTPPFEVFKIGLVLPEKILKEKIHSRLSKRMRKGMLLEAKKLHDPRTGKGLSWKRMESLGLEYRYLAYLLQGTMSRPEMIEKLETEIWRYAKRQRRWFKRDPSIHWFNPNQRPVVLKKARLFLQKKISN